MALHGLFLAAQEACLIQQFRGYFPFNPSCGKQCQKVPLVNRPASLALLESVQDLLRRRQVRSMEIIDPADRPEDFPLPRLGKGVAGHFRCLMDRHRSCFSSRGFFFPQASPASRPRRGKGHASP